jgi:acyl carrier protein
MARAQGSRVLLGEPEASLAAIWEEVLGVQEVGPDDDFFDLGGHSLLSMRVATRVQRRFGASVPLPVLFEARTVRQLAGLLRNAHPSDQGAVADDDLAAPVSAGPSLRAVSRDAFKVNRASMVTDD